MLQARPLTLDYATPRRASQLAVRLGIAIAGASASLISAGIVITYSDLLAAQWARIAYLNTDWGQTERALVPAHVVSLIVPLVVSIFGYGAAARVPAYARYPRLVMMIAIISWIAAILWTQLR